MLGLLLASCSSNGLSTAVPNPTFTLPTVVNLPTSSSAIPSPTQTPMALSLSLEDLNLNTPQDILEEVSYFGGMGGPWNPCWEENYQSPFIPENIYNNPKRIGFVEIYVCGIYSYHENVDISVELPDDTLRYYQAHSIPVGNDSPDPEQKYMIRFYYEIEPDDPIGNYHFVFRGNGWILDKYFNVVDITYPSFIYHEGKLFFKFQPNEKVRLFVYGMADNGPKMIGWRYFQVDASGVLIVHTDYSDYYYSAVGDITGEVQISVRDYRTLLGITPIVK